MQLGVTIPGGEPFLNRHFGELVRRAEALGYTEAWTGEAYGNDAFGPLAAAATITDKMRLGAGIAPVFTRPPPLLAMSSATIQAISGGRFVLGLGISSPQIVQNWMGIPFTRPLTRMRETVAVVRAALAGERVVLEGKTVSVKGFRLDVELDSPPPIFLAAQGAKMLHLTGEIGDGLVTNFAPPESVSWMMDHVAQGARAAGRPAPREVVARIIALVDEDREQVIIKMRRHFTPYLITPGYNQFFAAAGFEAEAAGAQSAWRAGDRERAVASVSERMLSSTYLFGEAAYCRERLRAYAEGGVTSAILAFVSLAPTPEERRVKILAALENLAPR